MAGRRFGIVCLVAACAAVLLSVTPLAQTTETQGVSPEDLARWWDAAHVSPPSSPLVDHAEIVRRLDAVKTAAPDLFAVEKIGESIEGRSINYVRAGSGSTGVLLWSQMHGDEATATSALFDLFEFLRRYRDEPAIRRILSQLTLHVVPMLNPDGAERFQRRNAQSIDVNRDALRLQTPEGKALKALRDRLNPAVGFNLHNQGWRTSVGRPPKPASISLLSVAFDDARTENAGRKLTKQICSVIRDALEPFAPGQIGRYDDEFEVRAFGDNVTLWGTPVVLIETGPWPSAEPDPALVRLNFIALVSALDALASGQVERADPGRYESLPMNESRMFYVLVRNGTVINGAGVPPFVADVGIIANRRVQLNDGRREIQMTMTVDDMGDLSTMGGLRTIDAAGMTVVPLVDDGLAAGQVVDLPEWKTAAPASIAVGQPARLVILKPAAEPGKFVVDTVLR
ncbi:MAG TPA: M14 family metallopeptidase [Vicinamibacterales bacterium]|nr:M14 family metallopeptidase [Vicinamibacterales bacterium]